MEDLKDSYQAEEYLLTNSLENSIYEGITCNVFAFYLNDSSVMYTCNNEEEILVGSMFELILEVLLELKIKVVFEKPKLDRIQSLFLTSAAKPFVGVKTLGKLNDENEICIRTELKVDFEFISKVRFLLIKRMNNIIIDVAL